MDNITLKSYISSFSFTLLNMYLMRWAGHVARMERGKVYTGFWWGNLMERDHLGDPGVDWRIILKWIFSKWDLGLWNWSDLD